MNGSSENLLILARPVTNRLRFITGILAGRLMGIPFRLTSSDDEFSSYEGPRLVYGTEPRPGCLFVRACGLLEEESLRNAAPAVTRIHGDPLLFPVTDPATCLPFDPFAASFYLVSRYEEYVSPIRDRYGRFPATESIAFRHGFLDRPVVHDWARLMAEKLRELYPGLRISNPTYRYQPTIDIDHAWQFHARPLHRTLGGFGRSMAGGKFREMALRFRVLGGFVPDPYDTYDYIRKVHGPSGIRPLYFVLFSDRGGSDNNVRLTDPRFHSLLRNLDERGEVGIHPSLGASHHPSLLDREYEGLCRVLGRDVKHSRQHFLAVSFPGTYHELLRLGITDDYSLGYASHPGFRAGIAVPFPFFDLTAGLESELLLHPLSVMDVTLRDYLRLTATESLEKLPGIIESNRSAGGEFVSLWHNESLCETGRWPGWRRVYETLVSLASARNHS